MNERNAIVTASGKEFETDFVSVINNGTIMYIRIKNSNIGEIATYFGNPEETKLLRYNGQEFENFRLDALVNEGTAYRVNLVR